MLLVLPLYLGWACCSNTCFSSFCWAAFWCWCRHRWLSAPRQRPSRWSMLRDRLPLASPWWQVVYGATSMFVIGFYGHWRCPMRCSVQRCFTGSTARTCWRAGGQASACLKPGRAPSPSRSLRQRAARTPWRREARMRRRLPGFPAAPHVRVPVIAAGGRRMAVIAFRHALVAGLCRCGWGQF